MSSQPESMVTYPERKGVVPHKPQEKIRTIVISGGPLMLSTSTLVSIINFVTNVAMARLLGPAQFSQVTAAVTILMLVSAMTLTFQLVCTKFVARNESSSAKSGVYRPLLRQGWIVSLAVGTALCLAQKPMALYLHLPDPWILGVLAIGIAAYVPLGARRGAMQGTCSFGRLSGNYLVEAVIRFSTAVFLVALGYGVLGAVGAISLSVIIAYLIPSLPPQFQAAPQAPSQPASFREGLQAIVFFVGQVIINNIDILLVKHFFAPEEAGFYAAVALVGRVLYFAAWSVVSAMFPVSAAAKSRQEDPQVLALPLMLVLGVVVTFILIVSLFPAIIMRAIFGAAFTTAGPLLTLYATATGLYAFSVVLMTYEMSRRIANTGWLQLVFCGVLIVAIGLFHSTLREVVVVQVILMAVLLLMVSLPFFRRYKQLSIEETT